MEKEYAHTTIGGNYYCSTLIEQAHVSLAFLAPVLFPGSCPVPKFTKFLTINAIAFFTCPTS